MNIRRIVISPVIQQISAIVTILLGIPTIGAWLVDLHGLTSSLTLRNLATYKDFLFSLTILSALTYFAASYWRLSRKFTVGLIDRFKKRLSLNWEFEGNWHLVEPGVLSVTNSDAGGITKVGSHWENYDFTFETKIINECSTWIVRAQNLNDYFMFQCRSDVIRPHQRVTVPIIQQQSSNVPTIAPAYGIVWQVGWKIWSGEPHHSDLSEWTTVRISVHGPDVTIFIADKQVFRKENFLTYPTGKVGFRNDGSENAYFRNVRVRLID